jgi:hypothetical protein
MPFYEPDLEELVLHGVQQARLSFADDSGSSARLVERRMCTLHGRGCPARGRGSADLSSVADVTLVYIDISCEIRPARGAIPGRGSRPEGAQEGLETERGTPIEPARSRQEDPGLPRAACNEVGL